jgi:hypothetical protein
LNLFYLLIILKFFDDCQWADQESLELIDVILNARELNILIIAAYRYIDPSFFLLIILLFYFISWIAYTYIARDQISPELDKTITDLKAKKKERCVMLHLYPFGMIFVYFSICLPCHPRINY